MVGPNRFLRRFAGNVTTAEAAAQVTADYFTEGGGQDPALTLTLGNNGDADLTFIVMPDNYQAGPARTYRVPGRRQAGHALDPLTTAGGCYDVTVTVDVDDGRLQRLTGHLETGEPSVTG